MNKITTKYFLTVLLATILAVISFFVLFQNEISETYLLSDAIEENTDPSDSSGANTTTSFENIEEWDDEEFANRVPKHSVARVISSKGNFIAQLYSFIIIVAIEYPSLLKGTICSNAP